MLELATELGPTCQPLTQQQPFFFICNIQGALGEKVMSDPLQGQAAPAELHEDDTKTGRRESVYKR